MKEVLPPGFGLKVTKDTLVVYFGSINVSTFVINLDTFFNVKHFTKSNQKKPHYVKIVIKEEHRTYRMEQRKT